MGVRERQIQLMRRIIVAVLSLVLILSAVLIVRAVRGKDRPEAARTSKIQDVQDAKTPEPTPEAVQITVSAAGDCTLGTDEDFDYDTSLNAMYESVGDPSYFLKNVKSIFEGDDLTIVNLEGPLTTSEDLQEKTFSFKGKPEYTQILTSGSVETVNLANNHSRDYGEQGYEDTIKNVEAAGITSFGYERTAVMDVKGVKVGLVGIYVLADGMERESQLKENIAAVQAQGAQLVIVSFHWGSEKENYPDDTQVSLAHIAVDSGADLVLGHHPHVLQGIEKYKGKNIVYSLANFCFGGNSNPSDKDTMIFQQTFTITGDQVELDDVVNIIPCSISSESGYNNYQPTPAEGEEKSRIQQRIDEYSKGLSDGGENSQPAGETDDSSDSGSDEL
ncbi:CapA family protein [Ruminococcus sp. OA3]|uniref:CapA family protein n=1 Tax=Ruminococcus sp. OA3 TaxID=2914164 RepID=UPI001F056A1F|nr:CapA family protein [Ruminococcus sp. OA3]MCH1980978.1 CapA family protein [Ruminococcus sp. OA3]